MKVDQFSSKMDESSSGHRLPSGLVAKLCMTYRCGTQSDKRIRSGEFVSAPSDATSLTKESP